MVSMHAFRLGQPLLTRMLSRASCRPASELSRLCRGCTLPLPRASGWSVPQEWLWRRSSSCSSRSRVDGAHSHVLPRQASQRTAAVTVAARADQARSCNLSRQPRSGHASQATL